MKNTFEKFMRDMNVDVDERCWLDITDKHALSIIPEHNFHYRDENDYIHVAPRDEPYNIVLNAMLFVKDEDDEYEIDESRDHSFSFSNMEEFESFTKELTKELTL